MPEPTTPSSALDPGAATSDDAPTSALNTAERPPPPLAVDGEYYFDGPLFVFTAAYHLRRGYCCGNECRHCPYDAEGNPVPGKGDATTADKP